jgi:hypothetical protein
MLRSFVICTLLQTFMKEDEMERHVAVMEETLANSYKYFWG